MKFETFQAGRWQQRYQYKSFEPVLVNHDWYWEDTTINLLLENAEGGVSSNIPTLGARVGVTGSFKITLSPFQYKRLPLDSIRV